MRDGTDKNCFERHVLCGYCVTHCPTLPSPYPYPLCCSFFLRPSYSCSTRTKYAYKYITIHFTFLTVQGLYYFGTVTESLDSSPINRFFFALRIIYLRKNTNYICSSKFDQNIFLTSKLNKGKKLM